MFSDNEMWCIHQNQILLLDSKSCPCPATKKQARFHSHFFSIKRPVLLTKKEAIDQMSMLSKKGEGFLSIEKIAEKDHVKTIINKI